MVALKPALYPVALQPNRKEWQGIIQNITLLFRRDELGIIQLACAP